MVFHTRCNLCDCTQYRLGGERPKGDGKSVQRRHWRIFCPWILHLFVSQLNPTIHTHAVLQHRENIVIQCFDLCHCKTWELTHYSSLPTNNSADRARHHIFKDLLKDLYI